MTKESLKDFIIDYSVEIEKGDYDKKYYHIKAENKQKAIECFEQKEIPGLEKIIDVYEP